MEYNERNITAVEVYEKLKEVQKELEETKKHNKEILAKLENMQASNALFHNGFAIIFEVLRGLNEVKQNEDFVEILQTGLTANLLSVVSSLKNKHMKTSSKSEVEKAKDLKDVIEFLKMLKNI